MNRLSAARRPAAGLLPILALAALAMAAGGTAAPMTNEDVVRMTAEQVPTSAIIAAIRQAAATQFDLDPDVVIELRRAGVPDAVIEAMRRAPGSLKSPAAGQGPAPSAGPPGEAPQSAAARVPLNVIFSPWTAPGSRDSGRAPAGGTGAAARPEQPLVQAPRLGPAGKPNGLAFFVMCLEPTHVPDGWMASPLAGSFPRHHLLWFLEGHPVEGAKKGDGPRLQLDLPPEVPLELEPGSHLLQIGLAGKAEEEPWGALAMSSARVKAEAGLPITLRVAVSGRFGGRRTRTSGYHCRIDGAEPAGTVEILKELEAPPGSRPSSPP